MPKKIKEKCIRLLLDYGADIPIQEWLDSILDERNNNTKWILDLFSEYDTTKFILK